MPSPSSSSRASVIEVELRRAVAEAERGASCHSTCAREQLGTEQLQSENLGFS